MSGTLTILTPRVQTEPVELGRTTWRKQVLPVGSLDYMGRKLNFTTDYLAGLVRSFKARAFDAVPLQLADAQGAHNNDPTRSAGEVIGLETADDGLYATVSLTDRGSDLVREHPNLGVSVRIVEDLQRGDGKQFPAALQHVLACWDPRVNGMKPWAAVECTRETEQVVDMSALTFSDVASMRVNTPDSATTGGQQDHSPQEGATVPQLNEEELATIRSLLPLLNKVTGDKPDETTTDDDPEFSDEELDDIASPADDSDESEDEDEESADREAIAASNDDRDEALELANSRIDAQQVELSRLREERDEERWAREKDELLAKYAIAGDIAELAKPLLKGRQVVELSNGSQVNAGDIVRKVLHQVGIRYAKALDFSAEIGSAEATEDAQRRKSEDDAFFAQARSEMRH